MTTPCRDNDPELWFSTSAGKRAEAAQLCIGCPVLQACHAGAEQRGERWGVWGGVDRETAYRRRFYPKRPGRTPRPACGTAKGYRAHSRRKEAACELCRKAWRLRSQRLTEARRQLASA